MLKELTDCLYELVSDIQVQFNLKVQPKLIGVRLFDGLWENTKFLEVETEKEQYSVLLVKENAMLKKVAPWKQQAKNNPLKK